MRKIFHFAISEDSKFVFFAIEALPIFVAFAVNLTDRIYVRIPVFEQYSTLRIKPKLKCKTRNFDGKL